MDEAAARDRQQGRPFCYPPSELNFAPLWEADLTLWKQQGEQDIFTWRDRQGETWRMANKVVRVNALSAHPRGSSG